MEQAEAKRQVTSVWGASPAGSIYAKDLEPGTREFFEASATLRNGYEMAWMFDLIPFASFGGRKVLELGCGAGYDAMELCRNGADYTGIDLTPQNIARTRSHLGLFGFQPTVQEADAEHLPFEDGRFEVLFSNGVLHHTPDMPRAFREAYRVLQPGGAFWVIVYHKHSIFHWLTLFLFDHVLRLGFLKRSFKDRLGQIEFTTSADLPLVNVYSRAELRDILRGAGFQVDGLWVRKLVKEDLPNIPLLGRLSRYLPQAWLDKLGERWGWYVIAKARKP